MRDQHSKKGSVKEEYMISLCREIRYISPIEKNKNGLQKSKLQHYWGTRYARTTL